MKVAIIHDFLIKLGGAERVLQHLHRIYPDAPIYTLLYDRKGTKNIFESKEYTIIPSSLQNKPNFLRNRSKLLLPKFAEAIEDFDLSGFDLVISSSNSFAHGVITRPDTFHICYCYSPTRYLWDWHHKYLLENNLGTGLFGLHIRKLLSRIRVWDFYAASRVDCWVATSQTVAKRIKKFYRADSHIIYPAIDTDEYIPSKDKPQDFYLIVSRFSPYKNIELAVKAFNKTDRKLLIVGEGSDLQRLQSLVSSKNIQFLGYASDAKVKELMQSCKALIFPGEEDFGLTPIEAMSCGRPVLALGAGGVLETVLDGKTGLFFDNSVESLTDAIERFENNSELFSFESCRKRAMEFSLVNFESKFKAYVADEFEKYRRS